MSANSGRFQSDRVPSFAQMLKKNLPAQPPVPTAPPPAAPSSDSDGLARLASKVTPVTGTASSPSPPKTAGAAGRAAVSGAWGRGGAGGRSLPARPPQDGSGGAGRRHVGSWPLSRGRAGFETVSRPVSLCAAGVMLRTKGDAPRPWRVVPSCWKDGRMPVRVAACVRRGCGWRKVLEEVSGSFVALLTFGGKSPLWGCRTRWKALRRIPGLRPLEAGSGT